MSAREDDPCKCHLTFAYVSPMHTGHCCFWPESQTCHASEVAEWQRHAGLLSQSGHDKTPDGTS